jgi:hypothetical protein
MKSIKEVDEFVIHPNVIRSLNVGECVMVQKYPSSKSAVVRVKQEAVNDYLTNEEVQDTLQAMKGRYTLRDESRIADRRPTPLRDAEIHEPSGYWQNGI